MNKVRKILLINCAIDRISRKKIRNAVSSPSLGLLSIASTLIMHGYNVKIIDFFVENISSQQFVKKIDEYKPEIIGFSVYTRTVPFLRKILYLLDSMGYNGKVVVGGPHATFMPEEILSLEMVNYVLKGEGEVSFVKLLESINYGYYPLSKIPGLSYKENREVKHNNDLKYIENLDSLPIQPLGLIDIKKYSSPFTLITSRGCPGNCIYCASRAMSGRKYRVRSAENIISEIFYLNKKLKTLKFTILDDTFTADIKRFNTFIKLINRTDKRFTYRIESRGDTLSENMLDQLKKSGCAVVHVGIESGSQKVLNKIGKSILLDDTIKLLYYGKSIGIHMVASFIIGHYCDTTETIYETINLMKQLKKKGIEVSVASCTPFPGTPLYKYKDKFKLKIHTNSWQEYDFGNVIISTEALSRDELRKLLYKAIEVCA